MKYLDLAELRKRCSEGGIEDIVELASRYEFRDGKIGFIRNGKVIHEIDLDDFTVEMAGVVDDSNLKSPSWVG